MPRRNRNASTLAVHPDTLADQIAQIADDLLVTCWDSAPLCNACQANRATTGDYCALCQGQINSSARCISLKRR